MKKYNSQIGRGHGHEPDRKENNMKEYRVIVYSNDGNPILSGDVKVGERFKLGICKAEEESYMVTEIIRFIPEEEFTPDGTFGYQPVYSVFGGYEVKVLQISDSWGRPLAINPDTNTVFEK